MREARVAYYGLTTFMDNCVGQLMNALQTSGLREDTLIIYTSDHGEMLGDHGYWTKQVMYEGSAGVPLVLNGPGVAKKLTSDTPCSLLDIPATICTAAGMSKDNDRFGLCCAGISGNTFTMWERIRNFLICKQIQTRLPIWRLISMPRLRLTMKFLLKERSACARFVTRNRSMSNALPTKAGV